MFPQNYDPVKHANQKCVSFDVDGQQQTYFYGDKKEKLTMINQEKQAPFVVDYMRSLMKNCGIDESKCKILQGKVKFEREEIEKELEGNESLAAKKLKEFAKLTNEYADDAVVSMLATEAILYDCDMSI